MLVYQTCNVKHTTVHVQTSPTQTINNNKNTATVLQMSVLTNMVR